jgi:hypothetical protein
VVQIRQIVLAKLESVLVLDVPNQMSRMQVMERPAVPVEERRASVDAHQDNALVAAVRNRLLTYWEDYISLGRTTFHSHYENCC